MVDSSTEFYKHYLMNRYYEQNNDFEISHIVPYRDAYIDLETNPYENANDPKTYVSEVAIDTLVNRILTNQAIALAEGKEYSEDFQTNPLGYGSGKVPNMYKIQSHQFADDRLPRKRIGSKPARRSRSRKPSEDNDKFSDMPEGSEVSVLDGVPCVTLSVEMLRRYMYVEVEARVRHINDYYIRQWEKVQKEKLTSYAEMIILKEKYELLYSEYEEQLAISNSYRNLIHHLEGKFEQTKEAKRRRRQAKKQRKGDAPTASQSDDAVSCAHAQNSQEVTDKDGSTNDADENTGEKSDGK